jgi:choline kinase
VDWQLTCLTEAGIDEVVFVTGHGAGALQAVLDPWRNRIRIKTVHNYLFDSKNLDYSLYCAASFLDGPVLYLEGDLLLSPQLISNLVSQRADVTIAATRELSGAKVDTIVRRHGSSYSLAFREHGSFEVEDSEGEFICSMFFSSRGSNELRRRLNDCSFTGPMTLYDKISVMQVLPSALVHASGEKWVEIDTDLDLRRAEDVVRTLGLRRT